MPSLSTPQSHPENPYFQHANVTWRVEENPLPYLDAVAMMEQHVEAIHKNAAPELLWLLEHPPTYTVGSSGTLDDVIEPGTIPVIQTGRGGKVTYHGPGQRVVYIMLNLKRRAIDRGGVGKVDVRQFVNDVETWIQQALAKVGIVAHHREGRVGLWAQLPDKRAQEAQNEAKKGLANRKQPPLEAKIAAIGIRIRKGVSYHGVAINVHPDLQAFGGIVPCGLEGFGVTSCQEYAAQLGFDVTMPMIDHSLKETFPRVF